MLPQQLFQINIEFKNICQNIIIEFVKIAPLISLRGRLLNLNLVGYLKILFLRILDKNDILVYFKIYIYLINYLESFSYFWKYLKYIFDSSYFFSRNICYIIKILFCIKEIIIFYINNLLNHELILYDANPHASCKHKYIKVNLNLKYNLKNKGKIGNLSQLNVQIYMKRERKNSRSQKLLRIINFHSKS